MVTRVRSFNIVQWALISGLIYAVFGLIIGLLWVPLVGLVAAFHASMGGGPGMMGAGVGLFAIVIFPIIYFVIGFIFGIIFAALYNLVAKWTGGVEMTLDTVSSVAVGGPPRQI